MMTEQDIYDYCANWVEQLRTEHDDSLPPVTHRTFVLVAIEETDEQVGCTMSLVNPEIEGRISMDRFAEFDYTAQTGLLAMQALRETIDKAAHEIINMHRIADGLGIPFAEALQTFFESENTEEFERNLRAKKKQGA